MPFSSYAAVLKQSASLLAYHVKLSKCVYKHVFWLTVSYMLTGFCGGCSNNKWHIMEAMMKATRYFEKNFTVTTSLYVADSDATLPTIKLYLNDYT